MRTWFLIVATALAVVVLPQIAAAEDADKGPQRSRIGVFFERLDANKDGQISAAEIPERAPDRFKEFLKRADRNRDQKVSREELAAVAERLRGVAAGRDREAAQRAREAAMRRAREAAQHRRGRPSAGKRPGPPRHPGPAHAATRSAPRAHGRPTPPDPRVLFARMDKNKDNSLTYAEFSGPEKKQDIVENLFSTLDANGDEVLTPEELAGRKNTNKEQKEEM